MNASSESELGSGGTEKIMSRKSAHSAATPPTYESARQSIAKGLGCRGGGATDATRNVLSPSSTRARIPSRSGMAPCSIGIGAPSHVISLRISRVIKSS
jgi:hypothetical protein